MKAYIEFSHFFTKRKLYYRYLKEKTEKKMKNEKCLWKAQTQSNQFKITISCVENKIRNICRKCQMSTVICLCTATK